jgi:hypothetical protein
MTDTDIDPGLELGPPDGLVDGLQLEEKSWRISSAVNPIDPSDIAETHASDVGLRQTFRPKSKVDLTEVALIRRAAPLVDAFSGRLPLAREIADINEHFGVEVAQSVFTQALERSPHYNAFIRRVRSYDARQLASVRDHARNFEVTLVRSTLPLRGIAWGEFAEKWQTWARSLGFTTDTIDTLEENDIRQNARVISTYLFSNPHPRRILVTYGQGAAEFRALLNSRLGVRDGSAPDDSAAGELGSIHTWINVAGAFGGAGVARMKNESWISSLTVELSKYFGRNLIRTRAQRLRELDSRLPAWRSLPRFPSKLQVINVVGQPLRNDMPINLLVSYDHLAREFGPNDGAVGLFESIAHPGLIVPIPGLSQNIESPKFEPVFKRILAIIAEDASVTKDVASEKSLVDSTSPEDAHWLELDL